MRCSLGARHPRRLAARERERARESEGGGGCLKREKTHCPLLNCDGGDLKGMAMGFCLSLEKGAVHGWRKGFGGGHARWLVISHAGWWRWEKGCGAEGNREDRVGEVGGGGVLYGLLACVGL